MWFQPYARIEESDVATQRELEFYTKSMPVKITYKWKGNFNHLEIHSKSNDYRPIVIVIAWLEKIDIYAL